MQLHGSHLTRRACANGEFRWRSLPAGGTGGGGGLHFRDPVDVFADTAARDTAFESGGSVEGEHVQFIQDRSLAIVIGTLANPTDFQTYTSDDAAYDDAAWVSRADAVQGFQGVQGVWDFSVYGNFATAPAAAPAVSVNVATGVVTPPAGWTNHPTTRAANEDTYRSDGTINPATDSGVVMPTMSNPVDILAALTDDGVITGLSMDNDGEVTITRSVGADLTEDISANLAAFVNSQRGKRIQISSPTTYSQANDRLTVNTVWRLTSGDIVAIVVPTNVGTAAGALMMRNSVGGTPDTEHPLNDIMGRSLTASDLQAGGLHLVMRLTNEYRILEPVIHSSVQLATATVYDATNFRLTASVTDNAMNGDVVFFTAPTLPSGTTNVRFRTNDGTSDGDLLPLQDRLGNGLNSTDLKSGQDYAVYRNGNTSFRIIGSLADTHVFGERLRSSIVGHVLSIQPSPPPVEVVQGDVFFFQLPATIPASTLDAQIVVIGGGLTPGFQPLIDNLTGDAISLPDLTASAFYSAAYDGTSFRLFVPQAGSTPTPPPRNNYTVLWYVCGHDTGSGGSHHYGCQWDGDDSGLRWHSPHAHLPAGKRRRHYIGAVQFRYYEYQSGQRL